MDFSYQEINEGINCGKNLKGISIFIARILIVIVAIEALLGFGAGIVLAVEFDAFWLFLVVVAGTALIITVSVLLIMFYLSFVTTIADIAESNRKIERQLEIANNDLPEEAKKPSAASKLTKAADVVKKPSNSQTFSKPSPLSKPNSNSDSSWICSCGYRNSQSTRECSNCYSMRKN